MKGGAWPCGTVGLEKNACRVLVGNTERKIKTFEDLGLDGTVMLK
jgi:hypothetical protein